MDTKFFYRLLKKLVLDTSDFLVLATLTEGLILGYLVGSRTSLSSTSETVLLWILAGVCAVSFIAYFLSRAGTKRLLSVVCRSARFDIKTYVWNTRYYFLAAASSFALAVAIGIVASALSPGYYENGYNFTKSQLGGFDTTNELGAMIGIFTNNARAAAVMGVIGSLCAGLLTFWGSTLNGTIFGIVIYKCISYYGLVHGSTVFLVSVAPHGIIELPAIFLSGALALRVSWGLLQAKMHKMKYGFDRLVENVVKVAVVYAVVVLPALFVASFIESYVTTYLIRLLLGL